MCIRDSIDRVYVNKSPLKTSGTVAIGVVRESFNFSGHPYIGRIVWLSSRQHGFLVDNLLVIMCASVQVIVLQEYHNDSTSALEAKYVFPLDEMSVVCGFEAFINGKHVVGVVKQKETAHREYRQAVEAGHEAYLMDQEKEQPV